MKNCLIVVTFLFISVCVFSEEITNTENIIIENNKFALELYSNMKNEKGNLLFSPFSIYNAFSMIYAGSNGATRDEIKDTMGFHLSDENLNKSFQEILSSLKKIIDNESIDFEINTSFWPQESYSVLDTYKTLLKDVYQEDIFPIDYSSKEVDARKQINSWTAKKTNNMVKEILNQPLTSQVKWLIVNTIYFKGSWLSQFNAADTKILPFFTNNKEIQIPIMKQLNILETGHFEDVKTIKLPYSGEEISMYIILPNETNGLSEVENNLNIESINKWTTSLRYSDIELYLPKFKYDYDLLKVKDYFYNMGIQKSFIQKVADFSGIDGKTDNLYIDIFKHNAAIEVNEQGSKVAAATAVGCFPAGTLIHTPNGLYPIETLELNSKIKSYNLVTEEWEITKLIKKEKFNYKGDMITLKINNNEMIMTGTQPIYVIEGKNIKDRPRPQELLKDQNLDLGRGRWVEARDLQVGDTLVSITDGNVQISDISSENNEIEVYYLSVEKNKNHAFHKIGILAHNNGNKESAGPYVFNINHPFIYLIKEENTGNILFMGRVTDPIYKD